MIKHSTIPRGFTIKEVCTKLDVKPSTVRAWISRREIHSYKVDGRRYITEAQIAAMYQQRKTGEYVDMTYAQGSH